MKKVTVIDYGAGNLMSVKNALCHLGCEVAFCDDPADLKKAKNLILPGVGAFKAAADNLFSRGFAKEISEYISSGGNFLGICLGLQLLFEKSEESPGAKGLGIYGGDVRRFPGDMGLKVPQIGWNSLDIKKNDGIFIGIDPGAFVYFVHSYYLTLSDSSLCAARCNYGIDFDAAIEKENAAAVQFHPEKSGETGLLILENFLKK